MIFWVYLVTNVKVYQEAEFYTAVVAQKFTQSSMHYRAKKEDL